MKNEKGMTLIEVLVAIVITGILVVPLLMVMTGTFTLTLSQNKETKIAYIAQEVIEKVMSMPLAQGNYCWSNFAEGCSGYSTELPIPYNQITVPSSEKYEVVVRIYEYNVDKYKTDFNEAKVSVTNFTKISNSQVTKDKENYIELVTVVKKP